MKYLQKLTTLVVFSHLHPIAIRRAKGTHPPLESVEEKYLDIKKKKNLMTLLDTNQVLGRSLLSLVKNQLPINTVIFFEYSLLKQAIEEDLLNLLPWLVAT